MPKLIQKLWKFALKNYFVSIFLACVAFVIFVASYKLFFSKPTYVFVKVKMGQGLWWASTQKPSLWFVKSIKKGATEKDLLGQPIATIQTVRYYPSTVSYNQYDVYLDIKLKVTGNKKTGVYSFNRSTIGVGAPIDLEFPSSQFSGTITEMSTRPLNDRYVEKTVYLVKYFGYPWEYDGIQVGDKFYDGQENAVEIIDKSAVSHNSIANPSTYFTSETYPQSRDDIYLTTKLKGQVIDGKFVFGEEQIVDIGKTLYLSTDRYSFNNDYQVYRIE
ncbi:hypothetical protein M1328_02290 [Patescibacteria group bacterium]|nr:hypothetical protein [Patescibacteria group bacterium]